ncbi:MAG: hypothetical protein J5938_05055 [Clostridia bacterium]|nr:hypothetical protein [Clostridia bacterium]
MKKQWLLFGLAILLCLSLFSCAELDRMRDGRGVFTSDAKDRILFRGEEYAKTPKDLLEGYTPVCSEYVNVNEWDVPVLLSDNFIYMSAGVNGEEGILWPTREIGNYFFSRDGESFRLPDDLKMDCLLMDENYVSYGRWYGLERTCLDADLTATVIGLLENAPVLEAEQAPELNLPDDNSGMVVYYELVECDSGMRYSRDAVGTMYVYIPYQGSKLRNLKPRAAFLKEGKNTDYVYADEETSAKIAAVILAAMEND